MDVEIKLVENAVLFVRKESDGSSSATCVLVKQECNDIEFVRSRFNQALDLLHDAPSLNVVERSVK